MTPRSSAIHRVSRPTLRTRNRRGPDRRPTLEIPEAADDRRPDGPGPEPAAPALDEATYSCGCGFVFRSAVLTSVACPHCGDHQAW